MYHKTNGNSHSITQLQTLLGKLFSSRGTNKKPQTNQTKNPTINQKLFNNIFQNLEFFIWCVFPFSFSPTYSMLQIFIRNGHFAHKYFFQQQKSPFFSFFNHFLQNSFDLFVNPPAALQTSLCWQSSYASTPKLRSSNTTYIARKRIAIVVCSTLAYICGSAVVSFSPLSNAAILAKFGGDGSLSPKVLLLKESSALTSLNLFPAWVPLSALHTDL